MTNLGFFSLIGGVLLLLYGVKLAGEGFQRAAGSRLRNILYHVTSNRLLGMTIGAFVTAIIQSSSATTVILVGFVSSGLLSLAQAVGVILGANIGTTFTVQLIAFKVYDYAVLMVGVGAAMFLFSKKRQFKFIGEGILGFAFIFLSMKIMSETMLPLKESELFKEMLLSVGDNSFALLAFSTIFTAIVQSSAATIGISIAMSLQGLIGLEAAIPIILGANIGTCATAFIAGLNATIQARRVATAHILFQILGVLIFWPFIPFFNELILKTSTDIARQIANAHSLFNIAVSIAFLPLTVILTRLVEKIVPHKEEAGEVFRPKYLNPQVLGSPDIAFGLATREAIRMADIAQDMYKKALTVIIHNDEDLLERVEDTDNQLDILDREIKFYITKISEKILTEAESKREMAILALVNDMENIGDIIDKNLMELARKKILHGLTFSPEGQQEIIDFHNKVGLSFEMAISAFASGDPDLAWKVLKNKDKLGNMERDLKAAHIKRLRLGLKESIDTSSIHLDLLSNLKRINHHIINISYPLISKNKDDS